MEHEGIIVNRILAYEGEQKNLYTKYHKRLSNHGLHILYDVNEGIIRRDVNRLFEDGGDGLNAAKDTLTYCETLKAHGYTHGEAVRLCCAVLGHGKKPLLRTDKDDPGDDDCDGDDDLMPSEVLQ
jgi:hypothetical protein